MGGRGSGGRRPRSGRPPDPHSLRQAKLADRSGVTVAGEWTVLPSTGRGGRAPAWPLHPKASARERAVWTELWKQPQAIMWERLGQQHLVGIYVRRLVEAEAPGAPVSLGTLVRQFADTLGLTTPGLVSNRWRIDDPPPAPGQTSTSSGATGSRARLRVVDDREVDGA